jgi:hypothetical protein
MEITYRQGVMPEEMQMWVKAGCEVRDISRIDLSFEKFWEVYGNKVGNKKGCEKKWNALEAHDRLLAIGVIPRMQRYYIEKRIDNMPYPETFLNQRRWENLFE